MSRSAVDAAALVIVRNLQESLKAAPEYRSDEVGELLKSFAELAGAYLAEIHLAYAAAFARAESVLPRTALEEVSDVRMAIDTERGASLLEIAAMHAGRDLAQILRRSIAALEHTNDRMRALTKHINQLIEESGSRSL